MIVTFEAQIDPLTFKGNDWESNVDHKFTDIQLTSMKSLFEMFIRDLEVYKEYIRADMYVDNKVYRP